MTKPQSTAGRTYPPIGSLDGVEGFSARLKQLALDMPLDRALPAPASNPLAREATVGSFRIGNRFCIHPMEGWDGTADGRPTERTIRRWQNFGRSGAKLIWGGEAVAVCHEGRANPNQLMINEATLADLTGLRQGLVDAHRHACGSTDGLVIGLQLTHSGRYSRPDPGKGKPRILYHHPILDRRLGLDDSYPLLSDGEIRQIIDQTARAAALAEKIGFDFVDVKHCHGYLGHEFLSARTREGDFGGSFENRTRYLRETVQAIRAAAPRMAVGVRLSAFDSVPYKPDPAVSQPGRPGPGMPEDFTGLLPYRWGFGCDANDPLRIDLAEPIAFLQLLERLGVRLVNLTAGSPYYNPHIQRPALFPPSDGYQPLEDPLVGVYRQMLAARQLKAAVPGMFCVGTGYTYLQEYLPNVASAAVGQGWIDSVGVGRMVLSYPELPADVLAGRPMQRKRICRTFSDCTTAPRNGLPSGCYPLDDYYRSTDEAKRLKDAKSPR